VLEVTVAAGGSGGRKAKDQLAIHHEEAGFPASVARGQVLHAAKLIQIHIGTAGPAATLSLAMDALDEAARNIEQWRAADQKRCNYPYQRQPRGHA
jgi:hypothetical protein